MPKKIDFETVKQRIESKGHTLLSTVYENSRTKLDIVCANCGNNGKQTLSAIMRGFGCGCGHGGGCPKKSKVRENIESIDKNTLQNYLNNADSYVFIFKKIQCKKTAKSYVYLKEHISNLGCCTKQFQKNIENKKTPYIFSISKNELQKIIDESCSLKEVIKKLGFDNNQGHYYRQLNDRIEKDSINLKKINSNRKEISKQTKFTDYLIKDSKIDRQSLKRYLLKEGLLEYKCYDKSCAITDSWNGKKISLHLDHINGVNNDSRLENLRFLCPNCHSQTSTYSGRNRKKKT